MGLVLTIEGSMSKSFEYLCWGAKTLLAMAVLLTTANLATGVAFSDTAVRARVDRAASLPPIQSVRHVRIGVVVAPVWAGGH